MVSKKSSCQGQLSHRAKNIANKKDGKESGARYVGLSQLSKFPHQHTFSLSLSRSFSLPLSLSVSRNIISPARVQADTMPVKIREVRGKIHGRLRGRYRRKFLTLSRPQSTLTSRARAHAGIKSPHWECSRTLVKNRFLSLTLFAGERGATTGRAATSRATRHACTYVTLCAGAQARSWKIVN